MFKFTHAYLVSKLKVCVYLVFKLLKVSNSYLNLKICIQ